jgi:hypothetical protein
LEDFPMKLMRLVNDDQVNGGPLASGDGLNRANLNRLIRLSAFMPTLDHANAVDALGFECRNGLINKRERWHRESNAISFGEGATNDFGREPGLASASRQLNHGSLVSCRDRLAETFEHRRLVVAQWASIQGGTREEADH